MTQRATHTQPDIKHAAVANTLDESLAIKNLTSSQQKAEHQESPTASIKITDSAANKVQELIDEEGNPNLKLRAFVTGGGCSGLQYGFTFDEEANSDDIKITKNNIMLVVDPMSHLYLAGATIDYVEDLEGARFVIHNPQAKTTCGCGSSFNT